MTKRDFWKHSVIIGKMQKDFFSLGGKMQQQAEEIYQGS